MNILHLTNIGSFSLEQNRPIAGDFGGGIATSLRDVATFMNKHYHVNSIISCCYECPFIDWAKENSLNSCIIPGKKIKFLGRTLFTYLSIKHIKRIIEEKNIDVIHAHYFPPAFWGLIAAKKKNIPVVVTIHQDISDYISFSKNPLIKFMNFLRRKYFYSFCLKAYEKSTRVIAVSNFVKERMEAEGYCGRKIDVVYNGIHADYFKPNKENISLRTELRLTSEHILLGTIGRLDVSKGYLEILKAAAKIKKELPSARYIFAGEGKEKEDYLKLADKYGIKDITHFLGFRKDTKEILQNLDVFLMPTYHVEGFSIALLEAMASGLAILATNIGGNKECLVNNENGLVIKSKNVNNLTEAILKVVTDNCLKEKLSKNARQTVLENFTIEKQCDLLMDIYNKSISLKILDGGINDK